MMDHIFGPALADRHGHGVEDDLGFEVVRHGPPDNAPGEGVEYDSEIQKPRPCRHIGDIGDPERIRLVCVKVSIDKIGGRPDALIADRRPDALAPADAA